MKKNINYFALSGIALWLLLMNYEVRHPQITETHIHHYKQTIDSLEKEMTHLEARRDTIIERVVSIQVKWRERLVEARKGGPIDTIRVPSTLPMELDSCKEVGMALMERIEIGEIMFDSQKRKTEAAMAQVDVMQSVIEQKDQQIKKSKNKSKIAHIAASATMILVIIATL
jgi:uncharacterized RmlC-like cupin family protein